MLRFLGVPSAAARYPAIASVSTMRTVMRFERTTLPNGRSDPVGVFTQAVVRTGNPARQSPGLLGLASQSMSVVDPSP